MFFGVFGHFWCFLVFLSIWAGLDEKSYSKDKKEETLYLVDDVKLKKSKIWRPIIIFSCFFRFFSFFFDFF